MSRAKRWSKQEKFDRKRGRHRKGASAETKRWNEHHLPQCAEPEEPPPPKPKRCPKRPSWMSEETYEKLKKLR